MTPATQSAPILIETKDNNKTTGRCRLVHIKNLEQKIYFPDGKNSDQLNYGLLRIQIEYYDCNSSDLAKIVARNIEQLETFEVHFIPMTISRKCVGDAEAFVPKQVDTIRDINEEGVVVNE
jgi:hypothetical protein